jgi:hypothetical protein
MPTKAELLEELAGLVNERRPVPIARYFTVSLRSPQPCHQPTG